MALSKLVSSGQGGFIATRDKKLYEQMKLIRTHGVDSVNEASPFLRMGFNFRFTDLHASIALVQLSKVDYLIKKIKKVYSIYKQGLDGIRWIKLIPVYIEKGEIPIYVEVLIKNRKALMNYLASNNIETRPIYPDLDTAKHLKCEGEFPNSRVFGKEGLVLPCGPDQSFENIEHVLDVLRMYKTV
jgi:dTDP-4-amino-4,6-dideoxygalactose transaminase